MRFFIPLIPAQADRFIQSAFGGEFSRILQQPALLDFLAFCRAASFGRDTKLHEVIH